MPKKRNLSLKQTGDRSKIPLASRPYNHKVISSHSEAVLLLLEIGERLGYDTYTPDTSHEVDGEKLTEHRSLTQIPTGCLGELVPEIQEIDVLWFKSDVPKFAFEVEASRNYKPAARRLLKLKPLRTRLFFIAPWRNISLLDKFIKTDPFYKKYFHIRSYEQLDELFMALIIYKACYRMFLYTA